MTDHTSPELRIGDADRESAMRALGAHLSEGRLDVDEYGDRSARVTTARTAGELTEVFADLPAPHPGQAEPSTSSSRESSREPAARGGSWADRPLPQRLAASAVPVSAIVGMVLFFATGGWWWWFLLPAVVTAIGSGLWGQDWADGAGCGRRRWHGSPRHQP
ncbi:DUF1707 SHOCT-like domain-containing protein [Amycolatopsis cihanbeyliensis]|uniref:Uncharacterized protein DUF1707 n=1 Tax=Amycolatopsis cihanbeyliensis TaxID=1128664 RepID=A0A542DNQ4_AMYCI|nr:DUF1707 domain-containing protein [Amycolatopsis cihanbeyliensis]TQJ04733.1 uncharacterized protein DUF1707 [Amycolatopsis cihanbeyliensis]